MGKFQRISNRGPCPRLMLEMFGATDKRSRANNPKIVGLNGTGTKNAAVAALRLEIEVAVSSHDEQGPYFVSYSTTPITIDGTEMQRVLMHYQDSAVIPMQISTLFARNWDSPIGDDDKTTYRVVREYYTNACDEDPSPVIGPVFSVPVDGESDREALPVAEEGETVVYMSWHPEFDEMLLERPERWFKRLANVPPIFEIEGVGAVYPKSDEERTRVYCQGNLAFCRWHKHLLSRYDWSTDDKIGLSDDREFRDVTKTYDDVNRLLCAMTNVSLAKELLQFVMANDSSYESIAFGCVNHLNGNEIASKEIWFMAWQYLYQGEAGQEAILSDNHENDETARIMHGKRPVKVSSPGLRLFLQLCGVKNASIFAARPGQDYAEVEPNDLERERQAALSAWIKEEYPGTVFTEIFTFVPLTPKGNFMGLAEFDSQVKPTGRIGLHRGIHLSWTDLVDTALHEMTHLSVPTMLHGTEFVDHIDRDRGCLFRHKKNIPEEPMVDLETFPLHVLPEKK